MRRLPLWCAAGLSALLATLCPGSSGAFTHVVQKGETLASIAEHIYGRIHYERILVYANGLDACGGVPIVPGMRLEVPTLTHRRVVAGESWQGLAKELLGDEQRAEVLAKANDAKSWVPPEDGADIVVPYNLRFAVQQHETAPSISARFFADNESAWMLDRYNNIGGHALERGEVVLVPLTDLPLTEEGQAEARSWDAPGRSELAGATREAQRKVSSELPQLRTELRNGLYLEASVRANRLLAQGDLTRPQLAELNHLLTEAYVALDARGLAAAACEQWRKADAQALLDPVLTSPKVLDACKAAESHK